MLKIINGHAGFAHISATDEKAIMLAIFGKGNKIVFNPWDNDSDEAFDYEILSNNLIRIKDGLLVDNGTIASINYGDYEEVDIANGTSGYKRKDLIVARYTRNPATDIESFVLDVIQGEPNASDATDPEYETGNLAKGDNEDVFPLYRVNIDGFSIESIDRLFSTTASIIV